jgi:hypothetical protein
MWLSAGADPDTMSDIVQALVVSPPRPSLSSSLSSSPSPVAAR